MTASRAVAARPDDQERSTPSDSGRVAHLTAIRVGTWAAVILAIVNLWFWIAFVFYVPILSAPWRGMADYQSRFDPTVYFAWAMPAFLFAPAFLAMIACVHAWAKESQRTWTLLALAFALPGATLMAANYYIQMTVVPHDLASGTIDGLRLWLYAPPYPFTIPGALEGVGYGFEAAALLLAAQAFTGSGLVGWVRWLFRVSGVSTMLVFVDPLFRLPVPLVLADGVFALVLLTATPLLLAVLWWNQRGAVPQMGVARV